MLSLRKSLATLTLLAGFGVLITQSSTSAQTPAQQKKAILKAQMEAQKKAEEAKKRDEERAKMEKMKAELSKKETGTKPEKFNPRKIGDTVAVAKEIDNQINTKLKAEEAVVGAKSSDAEFVRRVYLDLTGQIPGPSKVREFLESTASNKREKLIDELLASPNFGRHQSDLWMSLLVTRTSDQRRISFEPLRGWLKDQFNANKSWGQIASDLVSATGEQDKNPAVTFYLSNNTVDKMTDSVSKVFMGVSISCAQCHDHKFEDWKQTEYWSLAQFFMKVDVQGAGPGNKDAEPGVSETKNPNRKKFPLPQDAKTVPVRYLRDTTPITLPADGPVRPTLAKWLTSPSNPYFAKAFVNRVWYQMFGTGIVDPVDDMGPNAIPSHKALLENLSAHFAADQFNVKNLMKAIVLSETYQRSSKPTGGKGVEDPRLFARMATKVMIPEQLFDSTMSISIPENSPQAGKLKKMDGVAKQGNTNPRERFVNFFLAGQEMASTTEYDVGIPQALKLMNTRMIGNPAAAKAIIGTRKGDQAIEELYLATLSRLPAKVELDRMNTFIKSASSMDVGYGDVLWALLNCSEFTMVR